MGNKILPKPFFIYIKEHEKMMGIKIVLIVYFVINWFITIHWFNFKNDLSEMKKEHGIGGLLTGMFFMMSIGIFIVFIAFILSKIGYGDKK